MILDPPSRIIVLDQRILNQGGLDVVAQAQRAAQADVLVSIASGMGIVTDMAHRWLVDKGFQLERLFFTLPDRQGLGQRGEMFRWLKRWGATDHKAVLIAHSENEAFDMNRTTQHHLKRYSESACGAIITALTTDHYSAYRLKP